MKPAAGSHYGVCQPKINPEANRATVSAPPCRPALLDHSLSWPGFKVHLLGSLLGFRAASAVQTPATEEARKGVEEGGGSSAGESGSWDK